MDGVVMSQNPDEPMSKIEDEAVFHVMRILNGARMSEPEGPTGDVVSLLHGGARINMTRRTYLLYKALADRVGEDLATEGIRNNLNPSELESILYTQFRIGKQAFSDLSMDRSMLRVLWIRQGDGGCTFYRTVQPVAYMKRLPKESPLKVEEHGSLTVDFGLQYDIIVAPRIQERGWVTILNELREHGRIVVYETDDLLEAIPDWNPCAKSIKMNSTHRDILRDTADAIIVSTPELKRDLGRPEVTWVCLNGIHHPSWPMQLAPQDEDDELRILWAGGSTHENDLQLIVPAIARLSHRFAGKKRLKWVFVGYTPKSIRKSVFQDDIPKWMVKPEYDLLVETANGCPIYKWAEHLASQRCHMAIAPLVEHKFNESKSEIKCLEAWALGLPIIASKSAPYSRAIQNESQGILVGPDPKQWETEIERLARSRDKRLELAAGGLARLKADYLMEKIVFDYERALLEIADRSGKLTRPECVDAVKKRLEVYR
jgi:glycosyltransferase involved in cell wall biosynthesis